MRAAEVAAAGGDAEAVRAAAIAAAAHAHLGLPRDARVRGARRARAGLDQDGRRCVPARADPRGGPDGSLGIGGVLFGRESYRRFGKLLRRRLDPARRWRIGISHANVPEGAAAVREAIAAGLPRAEILPVIPLGTALGVHGGPGCVVVAAQELEGDAQLIFVRCAPSVIRRAYSGSRG